MNNIRHIFFDLDRTLWDFEANARETLAELVEEFNLLAAGVPSLDLFHQRYEYHNNHMWNLYRMNRMSKGRLRTERFLKTLQDFQISDRKLSKEVGKRYLESCPAKRALIPHAAEILEYLHSRQYRLHIISNGFQETQYLKLRNTDLEKYFDVVVTSEKARAKKPNAKIFSYSLKLAGALAEHSIMVGDDVDNDVLGAIGAGLAAIHFNPKNKPVKNVQTIQCLSEVRGLF